MITHLVWFRQDLRLHDNLALAAACRNSSARVLALYIATPRQWATHNMSPRQAELINAQLNGLQIALAEKGIPLLFREVDDFVASVEIVKQVCAENSVTHLFYNYQYEVNERARDVEVERALRNVVCEGFDDSVILCDKLIAHPFIVHMISIIFQCKGRHDALPIEHTFHLVPGGTTIDGITHDTGCCTHGRSDIHFILNVDDMTATVVFIQIRCDGKQCG